MMRTKGRGKNLGYYIEKVLEKFGKMRVWTVCFLLLPAFLSAEDYISEFEYGQMLYQDPRGVSCVPCHGDHGEGALIAAYRDRDGKERRLAGPDIRRVEFEKFKKVLGSGPGVMPRYFLTDTEAKALYTYIQEAERRSLEEPE